MGYLGDYVRKILFTAIFCFLILADEDCVNCTHDSVHPEIQSLMSAIDATFEVTDNIYRGKECKYYSKFVEQGVPEEALKQSLDYFRKHRDKFKNKNYITIADYSQNSRKRRFYLLNMKTGEVEHRKVSHGSGSLRGVKYGDATIKNGKVVKSSNHDGMMRRCRIPRNSRTRSKHNQWAMTRPGFFKTGEFYMSASHDERVKGEKGWPTFRIDGRNYNGMRMDGLVDGVNNEARNQGVVMHEAYYNRGDIMGRSFGCPAFVPDEGRDIMEKISGGSLYYSYVPIEGCRDDHKKVLDEVKDWQKMCN